MSDTALVDTLKALLDSYIQRSRAANTLMAGLKGANSTLNKTNRALNDYTTQNTNLDTTLLAQAQQSFDDLHFRENISELLLPDLRRETKALATQIGALKEAIIALQGEIVDVIRLDHAYHMFQASLLQDADLADLMPTLAQILQQAQAQLGNEFGEALRHALREMGIEVSGRPPRFEIGRFELEADFVNRNGALSYGKTLIVPKIKLSLEAVIKAYQQEAKTIEGRNEDGTRWMQNLYEAWNLARRKSERSTARINIVDCYYEMVLLRQGRNFNSAPSKRSFVDYSRAQFAFDFDEFTRRQRLAYEGQVVNAHTAMKSQADSPSKSLWIVEGNNPHDGRYIGDIEFVKD
jgi:hypothetical protein